MARWPTKAKQVDLDDKEDCLDQEESQQRPIWSITARRLPGRRRRPAGSRPTGSASTMGLEINRATMAPHHLLPWGAR